VGVLREGCLLNRGPGGRAQHWRPKFQFRRPQELDPYLNRAMEVDNFQCPTPQKPTVAPLILSAREKEEENSVFLPKKCLNL
jgi:hypothetical protein